MTTRLTYAHNGSEWLVSHRDGRTLSFPRTGGVWLGDRQIEGTLDFSAGRNTPRSKARVARYAREYFAANQD